MKLNQTLREQGITEKDELLLRRKFFFKDGAISEHDPIQLNLLYEQVRDGILNTKHPVTVTEAKQLAGLQCQLCYGDYSSEKHKPGFLE